MRYLSIITNFGCHYKCPYCIVKENNLKIPKSTIGGLSKLKEEIIKNKTEVISLSGGGDPLHNYDYHLEYYKKLFNILGNFPLELHTSYIKNKFPTDKCIRVVYHARTIEQLKYISRKGSENVRVVFVVTEKFTNEYIDSIHDFFSKSNIIDELSFRQMVDSDYKSTEYCSEYLKKYHMNRWWYIEQDDYNLYYCENKVFTNFKDIKVEN